MERENRKNITDCHEELEKHYIMPAPEALHCDRFDFWERRDVMMGNSLEELDEYTDFWGWFVKDEESDRTVYLSIPRTSSFGKKVNHLHKLHFRMEKRGNELDPWNPPLQVTTKIARIAFTEPKYIYHTYYEHGKEWFLNEEDKEMLLRILNKSSQDSPQYTYWQLLLIAANVLFEGEIFSERGVDEENLLIPLDTPIPDYTKLKYDVNDYQLDAMASQYREKKNFYQKEYEEQWKREKIWEKVIRHLKRYL